MSGVKGFWCKSRLVYRCLAKKVLGVNVAWFEKVSGVKAAWCKKMPGAKVVWCQRFPGVKHLVKTCIVETFVWCKTCLV